MSDIDSLMEKCPLKQEIRASLWLRFLRKVADGKPLRSYLTLYSPPLMDVKWLVEKGLIEFSEGRYVGAVGVALKAKAQKAAQAGLSGRLDLLLNGDINQLLEKAGADKGEKRQLADRFPFQAINLDYCDPLFAVGVTDELSPHIKGIESLIRRQNDAGGNEFALLITTRLEKVCYSNRFLKELEARLAGNLTEVPGFREAFVEQFSTEDSSSFAADNYEDFFIVALTKFLTRALEANGYQGKSYSAYTLTRDDGADTRVLAHVAVHVKRVRAGRPATLRDIGPKRTIEAGLIEFVKKFEVPDLLLSRDAATLQAKHGAMLTKLSAQSFEVPIPKAIS